MAAKEGREVPPDDDVGETGEAGDEGSVPDEYENQIDEIFSDKMPKILASVA